MLVDIANQMRGVRADTLQGRGAVNRLTGSDTIADFANAVGNGAQTGRILFEALDADAQAESNELGLLAMLTNTPSTAPGAHLFDG